MRLRHSLLICLFAVPILSRAEASDPFALERDAEAAEKAGDVPRALTLYQQLQQENATGPMARIAEARLQWMKERSDDPSILTEFLRLRGVPDAALERSALEQFEGHVSAAKPGALRRDARALIADAWSRRIPDEHRAEAAYRAWLQEPGLTQSDRLLAASGLGRILVQHSRSAEALSLLREAGAADSPLYRQLQAELIRRMGHPIALAFVLAFVLGAVFCLPFGRWRLLFAAISPWWLALALYGVAAPLALGILYEPGSRILFMRMGLALLPVALASFVAAAGLKVRQSAPSRRISMAVLSFLASVSVGFLASERSDLFENLLRWYGI